MREKNRRKWTASEKLRIVLTCMQPGVEVSEVCRREGINPTMYYTWKKKVLASASQIFEEKRKQRDAQRERTERELARMKDVVAEITAENLELKKRFRARGSREDAAGVAAAGPRGGEADQGAERLAGGQDAFGLGCESDDVLPLASRGGVGEGPAGGAAQAGAALRGIAGGEGSSEGVCPEAPGASAPGVDVADGGRGRGVPGSLDGVPDFAGGEAGMSLEQA